MKYFPEPDDLTVHELQDLYRLKRFQEWNSFLAVLNRCGKIITKQEDNESLKGQANILFRHIGARAFAEEIQEFMEAAEQQLNLLRSGGNQHEKTF